MDREAIRSMLLDFLEQETWERRENFADDVHLRSGLNLDSVDLLSVAMRVEQKLGISIQAQDFVGLETVGNLLDMLQTKLAARKQPKAA